MIFYLIDNLFSLLSQCSLIVSHYVEIMPYCNPTTQMQGHMVGSQNLKKKLSKYLKLVELKLDEVVLECVKDECTSKPLGS
jgi:hypothetical protein